jgi:hypothetical protein
MWQVPFEFILLLISHFYDAQPLPNIWTLPPLRKAVKVKVAKMSLCLTKYNAVEMLILCLIKHHAM